MAPVTWILANGDDAQFVAYFTILGFLLFIERRAFWTSPKQRARAFANYGLTALNVVALGALPVSFVSAALWAESRGIGMSAHLGGTEWAWVAVLATLAVRSWVSWFTHWLMHRVPLLWRIHRVHHLDTELDVSSTVRFHPMEFVVSLLIGVPILVAVGATPWVLILYELLDVLVTLFSHARIELAEGWDRRLRLWVVTPRLHRVHHSVRLEESNSNYGAVFPIWDLLLRTYRQPDRIVDELGIAECRGKRVQSLSWLLRSPLLTIPPDRTRMGR